MEGANVKLYPNSKELECTITPESYLYKAEQRINDAKKVILDYKRTLSGYQSNISENYLNQALQKYNEAKYSLEKLQYDDGEELADRALKMADMSFYYAIPAVRNEFHGVWLRPTEKNKAEVAKTLDRLRKTGIDNVFLKLFIKDIQYSPAPQWQTTE